METEIVNGREKPTIAELKKLQKGQWIFSCSMKPQRFNCFDEEKNPEHYNRKAFTDAEWERFSKYDDFTTIEGSSHSVFHCGLRTISEKYAKWFLENKCNELYPKGFAENNFEIYEERIKALCKEHGIEFEGF